MVEKIEEISQFSKFWVAPLHSVQKEYRFANKKK